MRAPAPEPGAESSGDGVAGRAILGTSRWATALFCLTALAGVARPDSLGPASLVVAVALFGIGCAVFAYAYAVVVGRSRTEVIGVANVFMLTGATAPRPVRRDLLGALAVQVVVAITAAALRPFTIAAAATLVPMFGLAMCGLWAARHGSFPPRRTSRRGR